MSYAKRIVEAAHEDYDHNQLYQSGVSKEHYAEGFMKTISLYADGAPFVIIRDEVCAQLFTNVADVTPEGHEVLYNHDQVLNTWKNLERLLREVVLESGRTE